MTAEQTLATIPGFSKGRVTRVLANRPSNTAYLIEKGDGQYVLRLDKPLTTTLALDRASEEAVCKRVGKAGFGPEALYFDHSRGIQLRRFVPGRSWSESDIHQAGNLERLAALLRGVHALPAAGQRFDPGAAVSRYAGQLQTRRARQLCTEAEEFLSGMGLRQAGQCLCHNDLVCHNILEADRLMLIDWEYAGVGDPYFDLAVVVQHHRLNDESASLFIEAYLQRPATNDEFHHLSLQRALYERLLELWMSVIGAPAGK
jgi:thiamine kinase-like enzyme